MCRCRMIDLRTPANQAIMKLNAAVSQFFREHLTSQGFTEIHTPKIIAGASEGTLPSRTVLDSG